MLVLCPFLSAILWAAILVFTTWPMFDWLRSRAAPGRTAAAGAMVLLTAVLIVLPLALAAPGGADDVQRAGARWQEALQRGLPGAPGWLWRMPLVGGTHRRLLEHLGGGPRA